MENKLTYRCEFKLLSVMHQKEESRANGYTEAKISGSVGFLKTGYEEGQDTEICVTLEEMTAYGLSIVGMCNTKIKKSNLCNLISECWARDFKPEQTQSECAVRGHIIDVESIQSFYKTFKNEMELHQKLGIKEAENEIEDNDHPEFGEFGGV